MRNWQGETSYFLNLCWGIVHTSIRVSWGIFRKAWRNTWRMAFWKAIWRAAIWYQSDGGAQLQSERESRSVGFISRNTKWNTKTYCWWKEDSICAVSRLALNMVKKLTDLQLSLTVRSSLVRLIFILCFGELFNSYDVSFWHLSLTV